MREMKDSGVEWIGLIPSKWKVYKAKYLMLQPVQTGAGAPAEEYDPQKIRYIRISDFDKQGKIDDSVKASLPKEIGVSHLLNDNDILVATAGGTVGKAMLFKDLGEPCAYAGYLARYVVDKTKLLPQYLLYYLQSPLFSNFRAFAILKATIENISASKYANMEVVVPSLAEQQSIVKLLSRNFEKVDALIANQEAQIEKLKAYKQSLITEVVTKGLDPNVPMKDSGVEWIGNIPINWDIIRVKQLLKERKERSADGLEEPLSMSQKLGLVPTQMLDMIPNMATSFVGAKLAYKNDLVFNKLKAHLGVFSVSCYDGLVSPDYAVYYSTGKANLKYLEYLFKTPQCISEFRKRSKGIAAGLTRLYTDDLLAIECPFPSNQEQDAIVSLLNKKCSQIDQLIIIKEKKIEKLNQYKKSLIYEYVTGKKEVKT